MKKEKTPMDRLTAGYNKLMKGKKVNDNGKQLFENAIKKTAKSKSRGSK